MALIRCSNCGNPVSSKSKACPICGTPIAPVEEAATTAPVTPVTPTTPAAPAQESAPATPVAPATPATPKAEQPRTLNDILSSGGAPRTLNETFNSPADGAATTMPKSEAREVETPTPTPTPLYTHAAESYTPADSDILVEDLQRELERRKRSTFGLYLLIGLLVVLLIPAAYFAITYVPKANTIEKDYELLESARKILDEQNTLLQRDAEALVAELEGLKDRNDTMMVKYQEAVDMLTQLQKEKTYNYEQIARYKREVETLKGVMKGYLKQIDSLNVVTKDLRAQNVEYKREIDDAQLRADVAEEKADELNTKVRIGAVIRASGIRAVITNDKGKEVKVNRATRMRVDFDLTANELAEPGEKSVYVVITGPDGYTLSPANMILFTFEGEEMMASAVRKVDYENETVPVSIFYDGKFAKGTYKFEIYIDGRLSGSQQTYFE